VWLQMEAWSIREQTRMSKGSARRPEQTKGAYDEGYKGIRRKDGSRWGEKRKEASDKNHKR